MFDTSHPNFDILTFDFSNAFHSYLCTRLNMGRYLSMEYPIRNDDPVFAYQVQKRSLDTFDPKDPNRVNLLQVNTCAESIAVQAVYHSLPENEKTNANLTALQQCCYYSPSDFAVIAAKYYTPVVVVPLRDLFLRMSSSSNEVWGHLVA